MTSEVVALESYFTSTLPTKLPQLRRKNIVRLRGFVEESDHPDGRHRCLEGVEKHFYFNPPLAMPPIGICVEIIATEGAVKYFSKFWQEIKISDYELHSDTVLEDMVWETLAKQHDERMTSDDLHTEEFDKALLERSRKPPARGAILAGMLAQGKLRETHELVNSKRAVCHHRPNLQIYTYGWGIKPERKKRINIIQ
jgi:hypothetical protein